MVTTSDRITTSYTEGKNDCIKTSFQDEKSSQSFDIHETVEKLRLAISKFINKHIEKLEKEDLEVLKWFRDNTYSISSFFYLKGMTTKHIFPKSFLVYLVKKIKEFKNVGNAPDFIIWTDDFSLSLDEIRITVRELERDARYYVSNNIMTLTNDTKLMLAIINRMSSYIFWLTRKYCTDFERYWPGQVTDFSIEV
jgi:cob(I)alamin adenosyltransferase